MTDTPPSSTIVAQPTPGPWNTYVFDEAQTLVRGPEDDKGRMDLVAIVSVGRHAPHGEANAPLIAAAPELLAALKAALKQMNDDKHQPWCNSPDCWVKQAEAAIARATGGAQ